MAETEEAAEGSGSSAASLLASLQLQHAIRSDEAAAVALWPISAQAAAHAGHSPQMLQQGQRVFTLPGDGAHMLLQQPRLVESQHSWAPAACGPGLVHGQVAKEAVRQPRHALPPQRVHSGKRKLPLELAGAAMAGTQVQHPAHLLQLPAGPAAEGREDAGGLVRMPGSNKIVPVKGGTFGSAVRGAAQPLPAQLRSTGSGAAPSAMGLGAAASVSEPMTGAAPGTPSSPRQSLLQMLTPRSAARK